jgi:predicted transcriptional regulator
MNRKKTDFKKIVNDLYYKADITISKIAILVGVSQPTITRLANGVVSEPMFELGSRLVALHKKEMRNAEKGKD